MGKAKRKEWIQVNHGRSSDYRKDVDTFRLSAAFVGTEAGGTSGKKEDRSKLHPEGGGAYDG